MKIKIEYKQDVDGFKFAYTTINGSYMNECSKDSFEEAKEKLVQRIRGNQMREDVELPEPEEVEI